MLTLVPGISAEKFGEFVRARREDGSLSQERLATALSISQSAYSKRETGLVDFSPDEIAKIAPILGFRSAANLYKAYEEYADTGIPVVGVAGPGECIFYEDSMEPDARAATPYVARFSGLPLDGVFAIEMQGDMLCPRHGPGTSIICMPISHDPVFPAVSAQNLVGVVLSEHAPRPGTWFGYFSYRGDGIVSLRFDNAAGYDPIEIDTRADPPQVLQVLGVVGHAVINDEAVRMIGDINARAEMTSRRARPMRRRQ